MFHLRDFIWSGINSNSQRKRVLVSFGAISTGTRDALQNREPGLSRKTSLGFSRFCILSPATVHCCRLLVLSYGNIIASLPVQLKPDPKWLLNQINIEYLSISIIHSISHKIQLWLSATKCPYTVNRANLVILLNLEAQKCNVFLYYHSYRSTVIQHKSSKKSCQIIYLSVY